MSEANYHSTRFFRENLLAIETRKTEIFTNKPVYLGLSRLELSKIVMYEFWYDHAKPKYEEKAKLCYMNTDSFVEHIKAKYIYADVAEENETRFDTLNYELDRPLPTKGNKKAIGLIKDELGWKKREIICWIKNKNLELLNRWW